MQYALIADDLTGALDAGAGFAAAGLRAVMPFTGDPGDTAGADVVLVNTATRELPAAQATAITRAAAERLKAAGIERVYKKVDSVLRGHPGPELGAVLDVYRGRALVAPAFPAQGRVTRSGVQRAHGQPVEPFGGFLRDAFESAASRADIRDAETDEDLEQIATEAAGNATYRVWCGAAGLAKQVPGALGLVRSSEPATGETARLERALRPERVVVFAGTAHPATNTQLDALEQAHLPGVTVLVQGRRETSAQAVYDALDRAAFAHDRSPETAVIITGGETAQRVCGVWRAISIEVTGEALPGVPVGRLALPSVSLWVATKSGGFGAPNALVRTVEYLFMRRL